MSQDTCENRPAIDYKTPIYLQLREIVRTKIEDGEYPPGTAIPSENELADTYGINRITVRNAVNALVNEGILKRVQGKGVFVVGEKLEQSIEELGGFVPSVSRDIRKTSIKEQSKILRPAGDKFAQIFAINPKDLIYYIRQVHLIEGEAVTVEEQYVPQDVVPQLEIVNSTVFSLNDIFAFYGVNIVSARQSLEIISGNSKIRTTLDTPEQVAIMLMETTKSDASGRVVEYTQSYTRSDKISFSVELNKTDL